MSIYDEKDPPMFKDKKIEISTVFVVTKLQIENNPYYDMFPLTPHVESVVLMSKV